MTTSIERCEGMDSREAEEEKVKLSSLRYSVESKDPSAKEVDDNALRRFLRARNGNVAEASAMFSSYLRWRRSFALEGSVSPLDVPEEIAQKKAFLAGQDKLGLPVAVVLGAKHFQNRNLDEFKRFLVYFLDKLSARIPPGQENFTIIGDLEGWGYSNSDIRGFHAAVTILQDYYPERLGKMFIVHAPYIFMTVWKLICPFIDEKTRKKVVFVENRKLKQRLMEDIEENQIPKIYGGKLPLVPIQDC